MSSTGNSWNSGGQTLPAADGIEELTEKTKKQNKAKQKQTNKLGLKYIEKKKTVLSYLSVSLIKEEFQEACRKSQCHLLSTSSNRAQEPAKTAEKIVLIRLYISSNAY